MTKRKIMNIVSIVLGIAVALLALLPDAPLWQVFTYLITGLCAIYVGISGLRIK